MNTRLKRRGNASKTAAVSLTLLLLIVNMASVFALGPPGPNFFINVSQLTQKITAGESATYNVDLTAWAGQFNITVGLAERRRADWQQLSPLPAGVEAVYPTQIYIKTDSEDYRFPVVVKTSPDLKESTVDIEILVVGRYVGEPIGVVANIRLYVVPRLTSLGAASTVFYDGFDKWNERKGGWIVNSKGGSVEMYDLNDPSIDYPGTQDLGWSMYHPYASLRITKNFLDYAVGAERPIPSLNGSFVLEFAMRPDEKRINFTFDLLDTLKNTGIHTELLDGNLAVQGRLYGTYSTAQWYKFRFENNATTHITQWYLNGKYMDSLPFLGAPDRIKTEISGSGVGTGYIDDIFLQKTEGDQPTSTTGISNNTTSTASWLSGWNYRKSHIINSAPDAGNNYQVEIVAHRGNGVDSDRDVYLSGRSLNWPNDIRFTGKDRVTELNYWLEDSSTDTATFWVKIKDNLSYSGTTIYLYYGKLGAASASNGADTFLFFDNFDGSALDASKWGELNYPDAGTSISVHDGLLDFNVSSGYDWTGGTILSKNTLLTGTNYAITTKVKMTNFYASAWGAYAGFTNAPVYNDLYGHLPSLVAATLWDDPNYNQYLTLRAYAIPTVQGATPIQVRNTWFRMTTIYTPPTDAKGIWEQLESPYAKQTLQSNGTGGISPNYIAIGIGDYNTNEHTYFDYVFVRKQISPEPSQGMWGSEEPAGARTIYPSGWLPEFNYRKSHVVNSASGAGLDYQAKITVHKGNGVDSGADVYLNNHALSWPNDIRFTGNDGVTELNYWMEKFSTDTATFWVKVSDDLSYSSTNIYIYYGKSGASSASNGENTFVFFDDFSASSLDAGKWIQTRGSSSISNSVLTLSDGARIDSKMNFGLHYAAYFKSQYTNWDFYAGQVSTGFRAELGNNDSNSVYIYAYSEQNFFTFVSRKDGQPSWNTMNELEDFNWHTFRYFRASSTSAKGQLDNGKIYETTEHVPTIPLPLTIETRPYYSGTLKTDWVFVRKYIPQEPSHGSWSGEQSSATQTIPPDSSRTSLSGWIYRKPHVINNAQGAGTGYQVRLVVYKGIGIDQGENVYLNNHALSWPNDIRFTGSDGVTELNYWLESYDDSAAVFWVKLNDDLSSRSADTYLYYGKSNAVSASNGDATFIFFDDFSGESLNPAKWQIYAAGNGGSVDVSNGILRMRSYGGDLDWVAIRTASIFSAPYAWAARLNFTDYTTQMAGLYRESDINPSEYGAAKFATPYGSKVSQESDYVSYQQRQQTFNFNQFYDFEIRRDASGYNDFYINDSIVQDDRIYTYSGPTRLMLGSYYLAAGTFEANWVFIRKYASAEPNQGGWGREEPANARTSYPSGWLSGFDYRKLHAINSAAGAGADYQIKLIIHKGSGTDSGADVYLNNHALSWPYDIRFTSSDGVTDLSYWLESADSNTAVFWVKIRDDLSARGATLYVYYGRPNALSASNGGDTFEFFDDFSGSTLDASKWSVQSASTSLSNNILTVTNPSTTFSGIRRIDRIDLSNWKAVEAKVKWDPVSETNHFSFGLFDTAGPTIWWNGYSTHYYAYPDNPYKNVYVYVCDGDCDARATIIGGYDNSWHRLSINAKVGYEPTLWWDGSPYHIDRNLAGTTFYLWPAKAYDELNKQIQIDWVFIRKLTPTEPSHGSWGSEENLSGQLVITTSVTLTRTVIETSTVTSTQISTSTITQSTIVTNTFAAKSAEQATEPLSSVWAIGATIIALALTEVLLLKRTR